MCPVHLTEKLSVFNCGTGLLVNQSKLICASVLVNTGSPCKSLLLKYSPFIPCTFGSSRENIASDGTGSTISPIRLVPRALSTRVLEETFCLIPSSGVTHLDGIPL